MALSRVKTWNAAETLTASDLNAEFNNVCNHFGSLDNDDINSTASFIMGELIVGSGITSADGGQLHVHTGSAGTIQASGDADEAVFENSGASGVTILSGATSTGNIAFGDSGDADNGLLKYTHGATPTLGITVNATAVQSIAAAATTLAHDLAVYQDANNADSQIALGTSATEALFVEALNGASNKTLEELRFTTKTASGTANHGKMSWYVDEVNIGNVNDDGITLESGMIFAGNLTGNVTGNTSGTAATVTSGTQAAITTCANLTTVGTVTTGTWSGVIDGSATMTLGSDATGDIYYRDASGFLERLAAGADGYVLTGTGAGSIPAWEAVSAGVSLSGSTNNTIATVTGANALEGEANLTFDGSTLAVTGAMTLSSTSTISGDMTFVDNAKVTLGTGGDADLYYDGTNVILTPDVVGSGYVSLDGDARVTGGHVFDVGTPPSNRSSTIASGNVTINGAVDGEFVALTLRNSQAQDTGTNETVKLNLSWADGGGDTAAGSAIIAGKEGTYASAATADSYLAFSTTLNNTPTERMRIDSAGRIGVGCDAPTTYGAINSVSHSIVIGDTSSGNGNLTIANSTSGNGRIAFTDTADTTNQAWIRYQHGSINAMDFYVNGAERMVIGSDGNVHIASLFKVNVSNTGVAIGTTSTPASTWTKIGANGGDVININGSTAKVGIGMDPGSTHRIDVSGSAGLTTGTAWTNTSDSRIKTNVQTITGALDKIRTLRPVSYQYTDDYLSVHDEIDGKKTYNSFIAEEYETVFPDAVSVQGDLVKITPAVEAAEAVDAQAAVLYAEDDNDIPEDKNVGDIRTPAVEAAEAVEAVEEIRETLLTDLLQFTPHDLTMYLVAAVQELEAKITALESA